MKFLSLSAAAIALAIGSSAAAGPPPPNAFTISGGDAETIGPTSGTEAIPVGTTGYSNALLTISHDGEFTFEFLGCGDSSLENRFYVADGDPPGPGPGPGKHDRIFDCSTSKIGDTFKEHFKVDEFGAHMPFHFQAGANLLGPSVFNGEGPFDGTYTNGIAWSNTSIFYAIDGSTIDPGETSGNAILLGLADGGVPGDNDHQDLVVRITRKGPPAPRNPK